ncbi:MAG: hypothetical protein RLZZ430_1061 [Cyanobacteriota bacterium]|jgi:hypothetical protein
MISSANSASLSPANLGFPQLIPGFSPETWLFPLLIRWRTWPMASTCGKYREATSKLDFYLEVVQGN